MNIHHFDSTGDAYDACQTRDDIVNGDVLVIAQEGVVGIADTWPVAVTEAKGHLHAMKDQAALADYAIERGWPEGCVAAALAEIDKLVVPPSP